MPTFYHPVTRHYTQANTESPRTTENEPPENTRRLHSAPAIASLTGKRLDYVICHVHVMLVFISLPGNLPLTGH